MLYNYTKLRKLIAKEFYDLGAFATEMGLSRHAISNKLNNHNDWKQSEIEQSIKLLGIERNEILKYFFTPKE